jgi:triacylglycerol lipase
MPFDPQFALNMMLPLAEAAYPPEGLATPWTPTLPAPWRLVATIQPGNFGYIAIASCDGVNVVAVAFPGTRTRDQWLEDFDGIGVPNRFGSGIVHQGFQNQYAVLRPSLLAGLAQAAALCKSGLMWITGHSLGAALATLFSSDIQMVAGFQRLTYTWAGPRVGWHNYASWFTEWFGPLYRIVNEWDVVPHSPPAVNGYKHVGTEVLIDGGRPAENDQFLKTAHNLELSYRAGDAKLIPAFLAAQVLAAQLSAAHIPIVPPKAA